MILISSQTYHCLTVSTQTTENVTCDKPHTSTDESRFNNDVVLITTSLGFIIGVIITLMAILAAYPLLHKCGRKKERYTI